MTNVGAHRLSPHPQDTLTTVVHYELCRIIDALSVENDELRTELTNWRRESARRSGGVARRAIRSCLRAMTETVGRVTAKVFYVVVL